MFVLQKEEVHLFLKYWGKQAVCFGNNTAFWQPFLQVQWIKKLMKFSRWKKMEMIEEMEKCVNLENWLIGMARLVIVHSTHLTFEWLLSWMNHHMSFQVTWFGKHLATLAAWPPRQDSLTPARTTWTSTGTPWWWWWWLWWIWRRRRWWWCCWCSCRKRRRLFSCHGAHGIVLFRICTILPFLYTRTWGIICPLRLTQRPVACRSGCQRGSSLWQSGCDALARLVFDYICLFNSRWQRQRYGTVWFSPHRQATGCTFRSLLGGIFSWCGRRTRLCL